MESELCHSLTRVKNSPMESSDNEVDEEILSFSCMRTTNRVTYQDNAGKRQDKHLVMKKEKERISWEKRSYCFWIGQL